MEPTSQEFVCEKFADFYKNPSTEVPAPSLISQREFAFLLFKNRVMMRHESVSSSTALKRCLGEIVPSDVYHSCAYYENPEAEMEKKGWLGADLVFDIDADHIPTSCNKIHDEFICNKCGFDGKGITPETCPVCGSQKFDTKTWPCERCIQSAKDETAKLIDILEKDFGFSEKEIRVFFSGHRGYHVHVEEEAIRTLDGMARKEIVDYVLGLGLTPFDENESGKTRKRHKSRVFSLYGFGWNKRIKQGMQNFILNATRDDLRNLGLKSNCGTILQNKETIIKRCLEENRWDCVKGVSTETWTKIAKHIKNLESAKIDTVVTTDIHRLIRMNGTLHGKTGLKKIELPITDLDVFDPFKKAVAFKDGTAKVSVSSAPKFKISERMFGPYKHQTVELPTAAALLLICKGRAEVVRQ